MVYQRPNSSSTPSFTRTSSEPLASWSRTRNARIQYSRLIPPRAPLAVSTGATSPTLPNMASLLHANPHNTTVSTPVQPAVWRPLASDVGSSNCTTTESDAPSEMEVEGEYMLQHQEVMQRRLHTPRSRFYPMGRRYSRATNPAAVSYERFMQNVSAYANSSSGSSSSSNSPRARGGLSAAAAPAARSDVVSPTTNHDEEAAGMGGPTPGAAPTFAQEVAKSSRYLREIDRRAILARIDSGEKQSELAKEYKVSRAAICNLNKHRDEVFARKDGNPLSKHPKKPRPKTPKPTVAGMPSSMKWSSSGNNRYSYVLGNGGGSSLERSKLGVHVMKSRTVALLLTTLRKAFTTPIEFRRVSERLMRLLLEEALALVPIRRVDIVVYDQRRESGVVMEHPPCAISMEQDGCPMLELFHEMEPEQPTGYICFESPEDKSETDSAPAGLSLLDAHLPASLSYHNVFLLAHVASSGARLCAAVHRLLERGASKAMVFVVSLVASADAVQQLRAQHPDVKFLAAHIVSDTDDDEADGDAVTDGSATGAQHCSSNSKPSQTSLMRLRLEEAYQSTN